MEPFSRLMGITPNLIVMVGDLVRGTLDGLINSVLVLTQSFAMIIQGVFQSFANNVSAPLSIFGNLTQRG
jgi:hypothetical protein